jgi:CBS domain-containing protein
LLQGTCLKDLVEPIPQPLLKPTATLHEVSHAFVEHGHEFFYVSSDGASLEGVVTITDLLRAQSARDKTPPLLKDIMTKEPVAVALDDNCAVAANAIREYKLKSLPVVDQKGSRKLTGCLRVRRLMAFVLKETPQPQEPTNK